MRRFMDWLVATTNTLALLAAGSAIAGCLWFAIGLEPVSAAIAGAVTFPGLIGVAVLTR